MKPKASGKRNRPQPESRELCGATVTEMPEGPSREQGNHQLSDDIADLVDLYHSDQRRRADGRGWIVVNMITSLDGAISVDGVSGGLGAAADKAVFRALRGLADVILVAAGTVRAESYGVPKVSQETLEQRIARGQTPTPTIAVVSRSLDLDTTGSLFATPGYRPTVVTVAAAPPGPRKELAARADVLEVGGTDVDLDAAVTELTSRCGPLMLVEGGPTLNGQLIDAGLVDELCLTTTPLVVGGGSGFAGRSELGTPARFKVDRVATAGGLVFARYLRSND
jgi:riboflavin biosynthesis pyrimidine reductase